MSLYTTALTILLFTLARGQSNERIAGGSEVTISQYPFSAALLRSNDDVQNVYTHACGAVVLTTTSLLSAASCFITNGTQDSVEIWQVRVGSSDKHIGGNVHQIRLITPHPDFDNATLNNDIAVLRTATAMAFSPGVVEGAYIATRFYTLTTNQQVWAIGWGEVSANTQSERLRHVQIWVINQDTCRERYRDINFEITNKMVCAGWLDVGLRGQCVGDAGSPLIHDGVVVGIHSWSKDCASWQYPGVNTLISPYTQWIVNTATA